MIDDAILEAFDEEEQAEALFVMIESELQLPFQAHLGVNTLSVDAMKLKGCDVIVAAREGARQRRVKVLDLSIPDEAPPGWEWVEAYRRWFDRRSHTTRVASGGTS